MPMRVRKGRSLLLHERDSSGREAKLYQLHGQNYKFMVEITAGLYDVFGDEDEAYESMMRYIRYGDTRGYYDFGSGPLHRRERSWNPMEQITKNPNLGTILLVGGAVLGIGALLWKKFGPTTTTTTTTTQPAPGTVPPDATPAPPVTDGGVIDVQGLGYFTTNRRQRIRRLPNNR